MTVNDVFGRIVGVLGQVGIPYMLTGSFASSYHGAPRATQREHGQFNIVDMTSGWKIGLIVRKERRFSQEEFDRREVVDVQGLLLAIATLEDVLISKLEWAKLSELQRQLEDSAKLLMIRGSDLDRSYLARWIDQLGLQRQWAAARQIAGLAAD